MSDSVNKPNHYTSGGVECIDGIRAALGGGFVDYCRGNVLKYVWRCGKKGDAVEDLRKAAKYLQWAIEAMEANASESQSSNHIEGVWVEEAGKIEPIEWIPKVGDKVQVVSGFTNPIGWVGLIKEFSADVAGNFTISTNGGSCTLGWFKKDDVKLIEAAK